MVVAVVVLVIVVMVVVAVVSWCSVTNSGYG